MMTDGAVERGNDDDHDDDDVALIRSEDVQIPTSARSDWCTGCYRMGQRII